MQTIFQRLGGCQAGERCDVFIIPMVGVDKDVYMADALVSQVETAVGRKKKLGFGLIIEATMGSWGFDASFNFFLLVRVCIERFWHKKKLKFALFDSCLVPFFVAWATWSSKNQHWSIKKQRIDRTL